MKRLHTQYSTNVVGYFILNLDCAFLLLLLFFRSTICPLGLPPAHDWLHLIHVRKMPNGTINSQALLPDRSVWPANPCSAAPIGTLFPRVGQPLRVETPVAMQSKCKREQTRWWQNHSPDEAIGVTPKPSSSDSRASSSSRICRICTTTESGGIHMHRHN